MGIFIFLVATFANLWVWQMPVEILLICLLCSASLIIFIKSKARIALITFLISLLVLNLFQIRDTKPIHLIKLSNDQIRVRDTRLEMYPHYRLPVAHWLEGSEASIVSSRLRSNLFEGLDPNLYFFAGHPRERIGIAEFEKFPYLLLPVFFAGLLEVIKKRQKIFALSLLPLSIVTIIGGNNLLGSVALFPFFVAAIYLGGARFYELIAKQKYKNLIFLIFSLLFLTNLLQIISYQLS